MAARSKVLAGDDACSCWARSPRLRPAALSHDLTVTTLTNAGVTLISTKEYAAGAGCAGSEWPHAANRGDRDDALTSFDPSSDGLDFYESLEGMRVQVSDAIVVGPSTADGDFWVLADSAATAGRTDRGGVYAGGRRQPGADPRVSGELRYDTANMPAVTAGATFGSPLVGIMDYDRASCAAHNAGAFRRGDHPNSPRRSRR